MSDRFVRAVGCLAVVSSAVFSGWAIVLGVRWLLKLPPATLSLLVSIVAILDVSALVWWFLLVAEQMPASPDPTRGRRPADALPRGNQALPACPPPAGAPVSPTRPPQAGGRALLARGMRRTN